MFKCADKQNSHNVHQRPVDLTASEVVAEAMGIVHYSQLLRSRIHGNLNW
jgi:hypothetical protein